MKRICTGLAAALAVTATSVTAATYVENWEGFSGGGASPITGTPAISGWTLDYDATTPRSSITTNTFPGIGSTKAFETSGDVNDWVQLNSSGPANVIPITGGVLQYAFPMNVVSLDPSDAEIDIMTLETDRTSTYSPLWAIRSANTAGNPLFRTTTDFGWPGASAPISSTAFLPSDPNNFAGKGWKVLAVRAQFSTTSGAAGYRVYEVTSSSAVLIQDYTGATNPSVPTEVQAITAALCISATARSTANTRIILDDIVFWDDAFSNDTAFINAVRAQFNLAPASVEDWSLYQD